MQYWIDGHNLIGKIPDLDLSDPDDEAKLARQIKQWASRDRRRHVTLFLMLVCPGERCANGLAAASLSFSPL